ncbi:MAG: hypothetical protein J6R77_07440 [Clostridia bacterium]|nr:hypothetical protein [Clostridia bacterium]
MKKRIVAILLCLCLMIPTMGLSLGRTVSADGGYVLKDLGYKIAGLQTAGSNGSLIAQPLVFSEAVDFDALGYSAGTLGLQVDLFASGNFEMLKASIGQIEFTSCGYSDAEEIDYSINNLKWEEDKWVRQVIPLSAFSGYGTRPEFNFKAVNYMRMYFVGVDKYAGEQVVMKICNVRLVDMSKTAPSVEEDPIGDGSFIPPEADWKQVTIGDAYENDEVIVAGYNLGDYVSEDVKDYTPIIQSLLDGLELAGGGTLFIPAGRYPCYGELQIPVGATIYGEWANPEKNPEVKGTVLEVYGNKGDTNAAPFITMSSNSMIQNLSFWYPEQDYEDVEEYPVTLKMAGYTHAKNLTFVNAYRAIQQGPNMSGCPNITNVYGTPLFTGMDLDGISDIGRFDEIYIAPDYWINSGLPGAPASEEAADTLREYLYYNGVGIILRRIDWSYLTFANVKGYANGLIFDMSHCTECFKDGVRTTYSFPNGHCYGLTFENCGVAMYAVGLSGAGEMVSNVTIKDCEYGIWLEDNEIGDGGNIQFANVDISATEAAIYQQSLAKLIMLSSTIREGAVIASNGVMTIGNVDFLTEGPHIVLENGACSAVIVGNRDANGNPIVVENPGLCPVSYDSTDLEMVEVIKLTPEDTAAQSKGPARKYAYIANLDTTGKTDVSTGLQALLDKAKQEGGGTVFLPSGTYRMDGSVVVPTGVELKGVCDYGRIPYRTGTIITVYGGKGQAEGATIALEEGSGVRGLTFDYPEQYPKAEAFVAYPYVVQGRGKDVYVINIAVRNGYNGLDLMTYRCDNHYVEYFAGIYVNNGIRVGKGSTGGLIRNYQFNYNAMLNGASSYGIWENSPSESEKEAFQVVMQTQLQNHAINLLLGDVTDQVVFNCFSYSGSSGVKLVEENGEAPNALFVGHGCDYATVAIEVDAAEEVQFTNLQLTSFGSLANRNMYDVMMGESFEGEVTVSNLTMWAQPTASVCAKNGTLNVYGCNFNTTGTDLVEAGPDATLNIVGVAINRGDGAVIAKENLDRIHFIGGFSLGTVANTESIGTYKYVMKRVLRWDSPDNAVFDQNSTMAFAESFTGYNPAGEDNVFISEISGEKATATVRSGVVTLKMNNEAASVAIRNNKAEFVNGQANSLYRLEMRLNVASLRDCDFSQIMLTLYNNSKTPAYMATLTKDGKVMVDDEEIGAYAFDTWYRVAVEIDLRDTLKKTYQVYWMDDDYNTLFSSPVILFASTHQREKISFNTVWLGALADIDESDKTVTAFSVDYVFATRSEESTFGNLGDVDGDGSITSTDARLTLQYYAGKITAADLNTGAADVDGDGSITSTDARLILQYYAGKIPNFPA